MSIVDILNAVPFWVIILDILLLLGIITIAAIQLISNYLFMKTLEKCSVHEELAQKLIRRKYSKRSLLHRSRQIERAAKRWGDKLVPLSGVDHLWVKELKKKGSKNNLRRILEFSIAPGLFYAFSTAIQKPKLRPLLLQWLKDNEEAVSLRKIASAGKGEDFDGHEGLNMLQEYKEIFRDMTGDQEWPIRYFAAKVLLSDFEPRSRNKVIGCLSDTHSLIRKTVVEEIAIIESDTKKLFESFRSIYLDDPKREVRAAAKQRIDNDYTEMYKIDPQAITPTQCIHVMDLLDLDSEEDENLAMVFLDKEDLELRMIAASYLNEKGNLAKLLKESNLGDTESFDRNKRLLNKAVEVGVTGFLDSLENCNNTGAFEIAAEILFHSGKKQNIGTLTKKVFALTPEEKKKPANRMLYSQTINTIIQRGSEDSVALLIKEIQDNTGDKQIQEHILEALLEAPALFLENLLETFLELLISRSYPASEALRKVILKIPHSLYLHRILDIIKSPRDMYSHRIRFETFRLLTEMGEPYCIQYILENLPILPLHESRQFTEIFSTYDEKLFISRATEIFEHYDSQTRSTLMLCLPAKLYSQFSTYIKEGLKDPDPEVRIASVWTVKDIAEQNVLHQCLDLLRDPVERVRKTVSHALGAQGGSHALKQLKTILTDANEIASVKGAAIYGLGESKETEASDILVDILGSSSSLDSAVILALAQKKSTKQLRHLIKSYHNSSQVKKEKIAKSFVLMGDEINRKLLTILEEADSSLIPDLYEILDKTGFIDTTVRQLSHRIPEERKAAARQLSFFNIPAAFRGLVLAARDPNEDVRIEVVKALKQLDTASGKEILAALENDPDKRVRKYTAWAMERLRSEEL